MALLQDSTFKYTDSSVTPFVVKPYTVNGPSTPVSSVLYTNPDGVSAISANTSLVFIGRGTPYYGDIVQNNILHLLENFASITRPKFPTLGQLWYKKDDYVDPVFIGAANPEPITKGLYLWSGVWNSVGVQGTSSGQLDLGNNRIINVGNAIAPADALNLASGQQYFVSATGSNLGGVYVLSAGSFTVNTGATLLVQDYPITDQGVVNRAYLNVTATALQNNINTLSGRIDAFNAGTGSNITVTGGTLTGTLTLSPTATIILQAGGSPVLLSGRRISGLATVPVNPDDAASKSYVDALATNSAATYVAIAGSTMTGALTLSATANLSLVAGGTATFGARLLQNVGAPVLSTDAATKGYVDNLITRRHIISQTVGGTVTFALPASMLYPVSKNKLAVYMDGIKQYAHLRGRSTVTFTSGSINGSSDTGLTASTPYSFTAAIDGAAATTLTVTTGAGITTFTALVNLLNAAATTASAGVYFILDAYSTTAIEIVARSFTSGTGSSVTLSYTGGSLFAAITTSAIPVSVVGVTYTYLEVGNPGTTSTSITFAVAPTVGSVIEFILFP